MEMVERPCPVCRWSGDSNVYAEADFDMEKLDQFAFASRKLPEYMHYRLILCPTCGLLFADPVFPPQQVHSAYQEAAFGSQEEARFAAHTYGRLLPLIRKAIPNAQGALDIGTGDGAFLEELLRRGFTEVTGVEPSQAPIEAADPRIKPLIRNSLFRAEDFKPESMSLVTCFQTLEHLYEPMEMCGGIRGILKEGGAFYAVCHNRSALSAKLLGKKSPIFDIEHLQLFSPQSAKVLMEKAGFTGVEVKPLWNLYPLHYWIKLLPFPNKLKGFLIAALKAIRVGYLPVPLPAGNMAVIGYKRSGA
jgi:SAM-dependent methyltransferase